MEQTVRNEEIWLAALARTRLSSSESELFMLMSMFRQTDLLSLYTDGCPWRIAAANNWMKVTTPNERVAHLTP